MALPELLAVLREWPRLSTLSAIWFTVALVAEILAFTCNFALQRLALRTRDWFAVQFSMLATAGFDTDTAVGGLTTFSLLGVGGLLALPVLALPAILGGAAVSRAAQNVYNWVTRGHRPPLTGLDQRLLAERDAIRTVLGLRWRQAVLLILADVHPSYAFLATLAYRVASYWLPLLAGLPAYLLFRHRYGRPTPPGTPRRPRTLSRDRAADPR